MDNPVLQTLKRYDSSQDAAVQTPGDTALMSGRVIRTGLELFHGAPSPDLMGETENTPDPYELGLAEGERRATERQTAATLAMESSLALLQTHFSQSLENIRQEQADCLIAVLDAALPALVRQSFFQEAREMIKSLSSSKLSGNILVRCEPQDVAPLTQLFQNGEAQTRFKITPDENASNVMTFEWENGGADIDYRHAAAAVMRELITKFETLNTAAQPQSSPATS